LQINEDESLFNLAHSQVTQGNGFYELPSARKATALVTSHSTFRESGRGVVTFPLWNQEKPPIHANHTLSTMKPRNLHNLFQVALDLVD
jgi:hypothetical protein